MVMAMAMVFMRVGVICCLYKYHICVRACGLWVEVLGLVLYHGSTFPVAATCKMGFTLYGSGVRLLNNAFDIWVKF